MKRIETDLPGVCILEPVVHGDSRGCFVETYSERELASLGIEARFVQDNQSFTQKKGTIRGIHFQNDPMAQAKLVRVNRGRILDVAVDLRKGSPTYKKWVMVELSEENRRMLFIPRGFGHAFITCTDDVEFHYKVDAFYDKPCDRSIRFDDPDIGIAWDVTDLILSDKDQNAPTLRMSDCNFVWKG